MFFVIEFFLTNTSYNFFFILLGFTVSNFKIKFSVAEILKIIFFQINIFEDFILSF